MRLLRPVLGLILLALTALVPAYGAGTIFGLPFSQQLDTNGKPLVGAKLFIYEAGTTTPVTVYEDFGLEIATTNPVVTDGAGRLPEFWLDNGAYRVRLTTAGGVVIFDNNNVTAIGASSGDGGGEGDGVSDAQVFTTGLMDWQPIDETRTGWVRANGRTIGSANSGATERANSDTQALYEYLWNKYDDTLCPVAGGRGGSASADFAANKPIQTLDMRGAAGIGMDTMGNSAASVVSAATSAGAFGGAQSTSITITEANLPNFTLDDTLELPNHSHSDSFSISGSQTGGITRNFSEERVTQSIHSSNDNSRIYVEDVSFQETTLSISGSVGGVNSTPSISGSVTCGSGCTGTAITKSLMNPYRAGTWYLKL